MMAAVTIRIPVRKDETARNPRYSLFFSEAMMSSENLKIMRIAYRIQKMVNMSINDCGYITTYACGSQITATAAILSLITSNKASIDSVNSPLSSSLFNGWSSLMILHKTPFSVSWSSGMLCVCLNIFLLCLQAYRAKVLSRVC